LKLVLENISKDFGDFKISDIHLEITNGDYFIILGPSGAGKSLLFDIIAGIIKPGQGEIFHNGNRITKETLQKRNFGLVFQENTLFPHLNVAGNIAYPLKIKKIPKNQRKQIIELLVAELNIENLLSRDTRTLSGGEQKRVILARTLALNPDILLLDEPLSSLDTENKTNIQNLLKELNKKGLTILHITHDQPEALYLGNRIAIMNQGRILQCDTPADIIANPLNKFVATFLGINNFFSVEKKENQQYIIDGSFIMTAPPGIKHFNHIIIPSYAFSIGKTHKNGFPFKGIIENLVFFPEKTEVYLNAGIRFKASFLNHCSAGTLNAGDVVYFNIANDMIRFL